MITSPVGVMVACRSYKAMVGVRLPCRVRRLWCRGLARLIVTQEVPVRYRLIAPSVGGRAVNAATCKVVAHVALVVRIHPGALAFQHKMLPVTELFDPETRLQKKTRQYATRGPAERAALS
jgi:hypothetical protein